MKTARLSGSGRRHATRGAVATLTGTLVATMAGLASTPAQSAEGSECPEAFPVSALTRDQTVSGLTVAQGTTPEGFTGKVLGVLEDGIMPGMDMIMVRLSSPEVDRVGIWSGMSGSPVYAEDGRLIGAVAYGMAYGPSPVAGLTPAADMQDLLGDGTPAPVDTEPVEIPERIGKRLTAGGVATAAEVDAGLSQLRLPFGIAGLGSQKRFNQVTKQLGLSDVRMMRVGTAAAEGDALPIVAGGNLAASLAYGDVSAAAIGTATMVCGEEVVGFGHPMDWTGDTTLALHGADAVYVQEDPVGAGFKLANLGSPVGTIDQDRMPGIAGFLGAAPETSTIRSTVTRGARERDGQTNVTMPEWVPDMALSHVMANFDRVFDGMAKGSGEMAWTLQGTREDGTAFEVHRSDIYADPYDITYATAWDLYMSLSDLEYNGVEDITIDDVVVEAGLSRDYIHASVTKVRVRRGGQWVLVKDNRVLRLQPGKATKFKVTLRGTGEVPANVVVSVPVRKKDLGRRGVLDVFGGNVSSFDDEFFFFKGAARSSRAATTFDDIVEGIESAPKHDEVVADLRFGRGKKAIHRTDSVAIGVAVDGGTTVPVHIR